MEVTQAGGELLMIVCSVLDGLCPFFKVFKISFGLSYVLLLLLSVNGSCRLKMWLNKGRL